MMLFWLPITLFWLPTIPGRCSGCPQFRDAVLPANDAVLTAHEVGDIIRLPMTSATLFWLIMTPGRLFQLYYEERGGGGSHPILKS